MCKEISASGVDIEFVLPYDADFDIDFMDITPASPQTPEQLQQSGGAYDPLLFNKTPDGTTVGLDLSRQHDRYAHNVAQLVDSTEFDVIHAHDWLTFRAGLLAKKRSGKPLIAHVHATQFDQAGGGYGNPEAREIEYAGLTEADHIFAVSDYTKKVLENEYSISPGKISVVHNSMEVPKTINDHNNVHRYLEHMKSRGYKVVVNIGRKTLQKGLTHLLRSAQKVIERDNKVLFLLAGGGDQEDELLELAAELGISRNVIFAGWVSGKQWRDSFKIADVFIMPSVSEPFGLVALEAIGFGAPVIISKQSGVSEVLNNCFKVDFWDVDQMADMILQLTTHPSLAEEMWRNSYSEYEQLSWQDSAHKMREQYHQLREVAV